MSHVATIKIQVKNHNTLEQICKEIGLEYIYNTHNVNLFSETVKADFSFRLPNWRYPVVVKGDEIQYDNYNGSWGNIDELHAVIRRYTKAVVSEQLVNMGCLGVVQTEQDGEIILEAMMEG